MSTPPRAARVLVPIYAIQFLSWAAMFCLWIYAVPVIAIGLFHADGSAERMGRALAVIGALYAVYAILGASIAFALPRALARLGVRTAYAGALAIAAPGILAVGLADSGWWLAPAFAAIGVGWGVMGNIPYALVSAVAPPGRGAHWLRLFAFSTVAPQVVTTLVLALVGPRLGAGQVHWVMLAGGGLMAAAAVLAALFGGRFAVAPEDW